MCCGEHGGVLLVFLSLLHAFGVMGRDVVVLSNVAAVCWQLYVLVSLV
jgi:hypothetical protein